MNDKCVIIGAGGHAKVVIDAAKKNGFEVIGVTDETLEIGSECLGCAVLGKDDILKQIYSSDLKTAFMGIGQVGYPALRNKLYEKIKKDGYVFPKLVHPTAYVGMNVQIGDGTLICPYAVINPEAVIGELCIINSAAVVEHEVCVEDGVHIAVHATILGQAYIKKNTFIGAGSVVLQGVSVGENCIIGAGSVVLYDIPDNCVAVGTPAKIVKRRA